MRQEEIENIKHPTNQLTVEAFLATSMKASLIKWHEAIDADIATARGNELHELQRAKGVRRHPSTIKGFLTKEEAWDAICRCTPDDLIFHGLTVVSDQKAFYLTDDSLLGYKAYPPKTFIGCTFSLPLGTAHKTFKSIDEFIAHFCKDERYLASPQEVVDYINATYYTE